MNQITKRVLLSIGVLSIAMLSSCSSDSKKEAKKDTAVEKEIVKEKLIANDFYVEPLNPTAIQISAYNQLSDAVEKVDDAKEAEMVAVNFALNFFTLSNKQSAEDMGGLEYIPSDMIGKYMIFAQAYYYNNYPTIVNDYGKKSLPEITKYKVEAMEPASFTYNNGACEGYTVTLRLTYADTEIPKEKLKTKMTVNVALLQDFSYDRTKDYTEVVVYDTEMQNVYRVLAVDDEGTE